MADINSAEFWDEAYRAELDGWDMGTATPVFVDLLNRHGRDFTAIGGPDYSRRPVAPKAALPCCGRGYDAALFADHGFDVTAIDFSAEALEHLRDHTITRPALRTVQADLFSLDADFDGAFDLIVEFTCGCGIDPARRTVLVEVMNRILVPGGHVMLLLFPVDGRPGGPPFAIDVDEWKTLMWPYFDLTWDVVPTTSVKPRRDRERLMMWRKRDAVGVTV